MHSSSSRVSNENKAAPFQKTSNTRKEVAQKITGHHFSLSPSPLAPLPPQKQPHTTHHVKLRLALFARKKTATHPPLVSTHDSRRHRVCGKTSCTQREMRRNKLNPFDHPHHVPPRCSRRAAPRQNRQKTPLKSTPSASERFLPNNKHKPCEPNSLDTFRKNHQLSLPQAAKIFAPRTSSVHVYHPSNHKRGKKTKEKAPKRFKFCLSPKRTTEKCTLRPLKKISIPLALAGPRPVSFVTLIACRAFRRKKPKKAVLLLHKKTKKSKAEQNKTKDHDDERNLEKSIHAWVTKLFLIQLARAHIRSHTML